MIEDNDIYEQLTNQYSDYIQLVYNVYHLNNTEIDDLFLNIIELQNKYNIPPQNFIRIISNACYERQRNEYGYFYLTKKLKDHFKISLHSRYLMKKFFDAFNVIANTHQYNIQDLDNALDPHREGSIPYIFIHDDIDALIDLSTNHCFSFEMDYLWTSLTEWSASYGAIKCFKYLLCNGCSITQRTAHLAFLGGDKEIINTTLNAINWKIEPRIALRYSMISHEIDHSRFILCKFDVKNFADDAIRASDLPMFLHLICQNLNYFPHLVKFAIPSLVEYFLNKNADVSTTEFLNVSALHNSAFVGSVEIATMLIQHGAKVNSLDIDFWNPLFHAAMMNSSNVAELLIKNGCDVNHQDCNGWTALMQAVYDRSYETIELLLQNGADINITNTVHENAFDVANNRNDNLSIEILTRFAKKIGNHK